MNRVNNEDNIVHYNMFDIVIPVGPNDKNIIYKQIEYTKNNIIGYRNIYLITNNIEINIHGCIRIDENIFPFNIETIIKYHKKNNRNGWYLQQLLKLYAGFYIPNILDKYLVIDADTFFLKKTMFISNSKCLYNYGTEYHKPYFNHMTKLHESFTKVDSNKSGICHHMIFETKFIKEIINLVESTHNDLFYNVFLKNVDTSDIIASGASEYEIYFNYILKHYPDHISIRLLKWNNLAGDIDSALLKTVSSENNYDYISCHWYNRTD